MAKKRRAGASSEELRAPVELDARDARKRINTYEDVADSDDEFHANQDEIRLGEEPAVKRQRRWTEQDEFLQPSDEEVLGYSEDEGEDGAEGEDLEGPGEDEAADTEGNNEYAPKKGSRAPHDDEDETLDWGTSNRDLYGADVIETEEQALEEESEALRLQQKQLQSMKDADYGFDEGDWKQEASLFADDESKGRVVTEVLPQLLISPEASVAERIKILKTRYPEFEPLSKEIVSVRENYAELSSVARPSSTTLLSLKVSAAYLGSLTMYFSLLTSTAFEADPAAAPMAATELRDHPVMASLIACRELWLSVKDLSSKESAEKTNALSEEPQLGLSPDLDVISTATHAPQKPMKKSRAERHAEAVKAAADERKLQRLRQAEAGFADLDDLVAAAAVKRPKLKQPGKSISKMEESELGEEAPLTAREVAEKAGRKKSLRFYTSQITQKANKRGAAGNHAGGDDDIPYRERLRDRQARLNAEAEKRGKRGADIGADLGGDSDEEDHRQARLMRAEVGEDDYYDLIAARTSKKKAEKAALTEAQRQAALHGGRIVEEETVGADGKRKISYAIEKNKGLTPHRKKDVRNPRVKKRKKFDEKKKKLSTMKATYKGGEGRGGYGGELTGIKTNLVKSVKL